LDNERYIAAVNRMYYAFFYIVTAYFAQRNIQVKSYKGLRTRVHSELVSSHLIDTEYAKVFDSLFMRRNEFDYDDFVTYSEPDIVALYENTKALIQKIKTLITINE